MMEGGNQTLELENAALLALRLRAQFLRQVVRSYTKNARILSRIDRETMLKIENAELPFPAIERKFELAAVEYRSVVIAQNGDENLSPQLVFDWIPVDIEIVRIGRSLPIFEHIQPPGVVAAHYTHVVRNDIEDLTHAVFVQSPDETVIVLRASNLRIEPMVVDDVVAVQTAGPRPQIGRCIDVRDSQGRQIGNQLGSLCKRKLLVKLQAVEGH